MGFSSSSGNSSISSSTDIILNNTVNGQTILFDATTQKWKNGDISTPAQTQSTVNAAITAQAALTSTQYLAKWQPSTQYAANQIVVNPSGQIVSATTPHTSDASYSNTNWSVISGSSQGASGGGGSFTLSVPGALSLGSGVARYPISAPLTIKGITMSMSSAATQDVIIDINKNGTTIFTDQNTRPRIAAGQFMNTRLQTSIAAVAGDYITVDRDQVGGVVPPTVVETTSYTSGGQSVVIPRPSDVLVGDIQVAVLLVGVGGTAGVSQPATVVSAPAGWTEIGSPTRQLDNPNSRDIEMHLFWWRDDGSQTSWTFNTTTPTANSYSKGRVITVRGAAPSGNPIDAYATTVAAISSSTPAAPTLTTTVANDMLLTFYVNYDAPTATPTVPSGMTYTGTPGSITTAYQVIPTVTATGAKALSGASASSSTHWIMGSVAILTNMVMSGTGSDLTVVIDYTA